MNAEQERVAFDLLWYGKPDHNGKAWEAWKARAALQSKDREEWMRRFIELVDDFEDEAMLYGHPREADRSDMDKARAALIDHVRRIEGGDGE